ncbi:MAG: glycosyltransferase [Candidatus Methanoperedens sp.]|nr:glycosyltransferase [Candidatus Methanoperedens sp.]
MKLPLVTVVIPSFNHEKFIGKAIESVLRQTYDRLEIIIIDDGSKDNSPDIIRCYQDVRIRFIEQENQGAHNTINRGLRMAKGDYLCILNSDDEFHPDRIKKILDRITEDKTSGLACSYIEVINSFGKSLGIKEGARNLDPWPVKNEELTFKAIDCLPLNLLMSNFISTTSNMFFSRSFWKEVGPFRNLRFTHDWDFALRAAEHSPIMLVPEPLVRYRIHENNTIRENKVAMVFEIAWVLAENLHRYVQKDFIPFEKPEELEIFTERFHNSLYVYGCDKELFTILWMILASRKLGYEKFSECLLEENHPVRKYLLGQIREKLGKNISDRKKKGTEDMLGYIRKKLL